MRVRQAPPPRSQFFFFGGGNHYSYSVYLDYDETAPTSRLSNLRADLSPFPSLYLHQQLSNASAGISPTSDTTPGPSRSVPPFSSSHRLLSDTPVGGRRSELPRTCIRRPPPTKNSYLRSKTMALPVRACENPRGICNRV